MEGIKWFKHIKVQIAVYYLLASVLLVGVFGTALYYSISNIVLNETLTTTKTAVEGSGQYVEGYIDRLKALSHIIGNNPSTIICLEEHDDTYIDDVRALIDSAMASDEYLESIIVVSKDGHIITNEEDLSMITSEDMMEEQWYKAAIANEMPVLTSARMQEFSMEKDNWVISISQELLNDAGENIGVLLIDIQYMALESYFDNLNLGEDGLVFILNEQGEVVYHSDPSYFTEEEKRLELQKMVNMHGYDDDMELLIHPYALKNADWILVGVSGLDSLGIIRRQIVETVVTIGIILLIVVLGSGVLIANRITKPIKALEEAMEEMDESFRQVDIDTDSSYEATQLTLRFNSMLTRIQSLMLDVKEQEKYLRTYEINALQSQINPHFLYNTLDTIVWMAEFEDSESVIAITKSLAQFFRLSLSKGEEMISLSDEIDHARQYLFIQKQRYQDKLNYEFDIDEQVKGIKVPKIIIQPIVENAIYHGIRDLDEPGMIQIKVSTFQDQWVDIAINDNGRGFTHEADGSLPKSKNVKLGGVGLANVEKRLLLYYGDSSSVIIQSKLGQGTSVVLRLPYSNNNS